jgi:GNAT superfamily N-acetyltransferase
VTRAGGAAIDPSLLAAWVAARSVARGLPAPVPDHGGLRVDTRSAAEVARWVFAAPTDGLRALGRSIRAPRHFLKLCGTGDELLAALPPGWTLDAMAHVMQATRAPAPASLPEGYRIEVDRAGAVVAARVRWANGALAASGYAAAAAGVFVYDRIVTDPAHRRRGLGRALMVALRAAWERTGDPELLVATDDGRALYATLGWRTLAPYASASIAVPGDTGATSTITCR